MITIWKIASVNPYFFFLTQEITHDHPVFHTPKTLKAELFQRESQCRPPHAVLWTSPRLHFLPRTLQLLPAPHQAKGESGRSQIENLRLILVGWGVINIFCNPGDEEKNSIHFVIIQYSSFHLCVAALWLIALLYSEIPVRIKSGSFINCPFLEYDPLYSHVSMCVG